jgi:hypothetical protein
LVEVNQKIPDRDEAELRLAVQGGERSAASKVFDGTPASRGALDPAPGSRSYGCGVALQKRLKKDENNLDNAADVIHGNWLFATHSENGTHRELERLVMYSL